MDSEFWASFWEKIQTAVATWLPGLIVAMLLLLIGWLVAILSRAIVGGILRRVGLDRLAERVGIIKTLNEMGLGNSLASLLGRFAYWLVFLVFILAAIESLGLSIVTDALSALVSYVPNILAAALILLLGSLIARFLGDTVGGFATQSGISNGPFLGRVIQFAVLVLTIIITLNQLDIRTTLLTAVAIIIVAALALALALAFGLGNRELARYIMAGFHVKEAFEVGQTVTVRGHTGRLVKIGSVNAIIETEQGQVSIPNDMLISEEVLIVTEPGETV